MLRLFTYHRNSAGERVRIALAIKGLVYEYVSVPSLGAAYREINPQGLMPTLEVDGAGITQSAAILEYLEERWPNPALLPSDPLLRARARSFGQVIAADLHPLNNNRVRKLLAGRFGVDDAGLDAWYRHWIADAFTALEAAIVDRRPGWPFCFSETPGWAELHLVPQLRNARRFGCPLQAYPHLLAVEAACIGIDAFRRAAPANQPDYSGG